MELVYVVLMEENLWYYEQKHDENEPHREGQASRLTNLFNAQDKYVYVWYLVGYLKVSALPLPHRGLVIYKEGKLVAQIPQFLGSLHC